MGLDMYFNKKKYVWSDDRKKLKITGYKGKVDPSKVKYLVEEAGYWRKANAIHGWFVDNVQDGNDDCREYYVSEEKIKELLDTINKVIKASKLVAGKVYAGTTWTKGKSIVKTEKGKVIKDPTLAKELLPVREGFFFGNYDEETAYDQYYYEDLIHTKEILEKALEDTDAEYTYDSSW